MKWRKYNIDNIINADEAGIWVDMPSNYTLDKVGEKHVRMRTTGGERARFTVMFAVAASGRKLPPAVVVNPAKVTIPDMQQVRQFVAENGGRIVVYEQNKAWMNTELLLKWCNDVLLPHKGMMSPESMLIWDSFKPRIEK